MENKTENPKVLTKAEGGLGDLGERGFQLRFQTVQGKSRAKHHKLPHLPRVPLSFRIML